MNPIISKKLLAPKSAFNVFKQAVANISDAIINQDGEAIYNSLPADMKKSASLAIVPYAMRGGQILASDNNGNIVPLTHSRGGNATFVDKDGYIKWAAHNLCTRSEELSHSDWTATSPGTQAVTSDATISPLGTLTADKITEDGTTNNHRITRNITGILSGESLTISVYCKSAERTWVLIRDGQQTKGNFFNLSNGTIGSALSTNTTVPSITSVGNGWYKCSVTFLFTTTTFSPQIQIALGDNNGGAYAGVSGNGIYAWGVHVRYTNSLSNYVPTTSTALYLPRWTYDPYTADYLGWLIEPNAASNYFTYSNDFLNAAWSKTALAVSLSNQVGLDGVLCTKVVEDSTTSQHQLYQANTVTLVAGTFYTISVYVKSISKQYVNLQFSNVGVGWGGDSKSAYFDLVNGTVLAVTGSTTYSSVTTPTTATITKCRDGWFRITVTAQAPTGTSGQSGLNFNLCNSSSNFASYAGDGYSTALVFGAQLEVGKSATSYIPTFSSTGSRVAETLVIPSAYVQYVNKGTVYMESAHTRFLLNVNSQFIKSHTGSQVVLYCGFPTVTNYYQSWDGARSVSSNAGGNYYIPDMDKVHRVCISWGDGFLRMAADGNATNETSGYGGAMGDQTNWDIATADIASFYCRAIVFFTNAQSVLQVQRLCNPTSFNSETPFKAFKTAVAAIGGYSIPEADSLYQRTPDYLKQNACCLLLAAAFKGTTIYGLDNNGSLILWVNTRNSIATQINSKGLIEYCYHNLLLNSVWSGGTTPTNWAHTFAGGTTSLASLINGSQQLTFVASSARQVLSQSITTVAGVVYVLAIDIVSFSGSATYFQVFGEGTGLTGTTKKYYDSNGNLIGISGDGTTPATIGRFYMTYTNTVGGAVSFRIGAGVAGTSAFTVTLANPQLEIAILPRYHYTPTTSAAVYAPRFTYNQLSKIYEGFLFEQAATNLILYSNDFSQAQWTKSSYTATANSNTSPDGLTNGWLLANTNTSPQLYTTFTSSAAIYTLSVFVKVGTQSMMYLQAQSQTTVTNYSRVLFDISTYQVGGVETSGSGYSYVSSSIKFENCNNGWLKVSAAFNFASDTSRFVIGYSSSIASFAALAGVSGYNAYIFCSQVELGDKASSYIPTYGSQVTRAADVLQSSVDLLSDLNTALYLEYKKIRTVIGNETQIVNRGNSLTRPYGKVLFEDGNQFPKTTDDTSIVTVDGYRCPDDLFIKALVDWGTSNDQLKISMFGSEIMSKAYDGSMSSTGALTLFAQNVFSGNLKALAIFNRYLPDTEVYQAETLPTAQTVANNFTAQVLGASGTVEAIQNVICHLGEALNQEFWGALTMAIVPSGYKNTVLYSQKVNGGVDGVAARSGAVATRTNKNGVIEVVAAGGARGRGGGCCARGDLRGRPCRD